MHIIYTAYYSTLPYLRLSHILILGHMGFHRLRGVCDDFSVSGSEVIKFKTPLPPNRCLHGDSQMLCSAHHPPFHMRASPWGRVKRHLLPFPPAAAENNQRETKNQATQRQCQEAVPRGVSDCEHIHIMCSLCCLSNYYVLYPLKCNNRDSPDHKNAIKHDVPQNLWQ